MSDCKRLRLVVLPLLAALVLGACTSKRKTESRKSESLQQKQEASITIADPTPPDPPNSVPVPTDLKNMPAFLTFAIGGIASEGEKEGVEVQENLRLFRTDASSREVLAFYAKEMKDRGWTTDNQIAQSGTVGLAMQEYRHAGTDAMYLIISEPEDALSSDETKSKRHVALLPAKRTKP